MLGSARPGASNTDSNSARDWSVRSGEYAMRRIVPAGPALAVATTMGHRNDVRANPVRGRVGISADTGPGQAMAVIEGRIAVAATRMVVQQ